MAIGYASLLKVNLLNIYSEIFIKPVLPNKM